MQWRDIGRFAFSLIIGMLAVFLIGIFDGEYEANGETKVMIFVWAVAYMVVSAIREITNPPSKEQNNDG